MTSKIFILFKYFFCTQIRSKWFFAQFYIVGRSIIVAVQKRSAHGHWLWVIRRGANVARKRHRSQCRWPRVDRSRRASTLSVWIIRLKWTMYRQTSVDPMRNRRGNRIWYTRYLSLRYRWGYSWFFSYVDNCRYFFIFFFWLLRYCDDAVILCFYIWGKNFHFGQPR